MRKPPGYRFPRGMRPASVQERTIFYRKEFLVESVKRWFRGWRHPIVFALVIGRHTKIYPREYRNDYNKTILIDEYDDFSDLRGHLLDFRPESAYYDRNLYADWEQARGLSNKLQGLGRTFGQQLALDIDPENFECPIHGTLEEKMRRRQGLSFCRLELQLARLQVLELLDELSGSFSDIRVVYSGRGFHLHIFDDDTFMWSRRRRLGFVRSLMKQDYMMDEWVAGGGMRLIRLPYSLNGLVSRIATPLKPGEIEKFDPLEDDRCFPGFLSDTPDTPRTRLFLA